ncbi:BolA family protein [Caviibacterium pharyngocola]|uniref:Transcriptional regulator n=1 Tax=Caviibacterium pharyngocola TaxID=28159 RepID=A0A2M8RU76_9PAST|nr:BolA/IbaG family iron-sulfur metabolism protein [Caviibacterium pharyngocola]PJG82439.1 transcriptional regulator [Caviibacterium pharyngocola]
MSRQQSIQTALFAEFSPHFLHIENESHLHRSDRGEESHFKVVIVSERFDGMSKVVRHQAIYRVLAEEFRQGLHALALHTYTPAEWAQTAQQIPQSTACAGVGK